MLGNGNALPVIIEAHKHKTRAAHHCFLVAVYIELSSLHTDGDAFAADAVDLAVNLDQVVLLHGRFEQDLFDFERDHGGTMANLIDKCDSGFVNPAEHGPAEQVVVHPEVVLLANFCSEQLHDAKVYHRHHDAKKNDLSMTVFQTSTADSLKPTDSLGFKPTVNTWSWLHKRPTLQWANLRSWKVL